MGTKAGRREDVRFDVPLYTQAEAARYLAMPESTFRTWARGYTRQRQGRRPVTGAPLVTYLRPANPQDPSIPFIGLAEGMFLSALRRANVPLQQIRPALELVREKLGVEHALASKRLYVVGAQLLWEVSESSDLDRDARYGARDLIVLRNGQYVFRQAVEQYLRRIEYAEDEFARRVHLPEYEVADVIADPLINFGQPFFQATGTPIEAVLSRHRAGEPIEDLAEDYGLPYDEVVEVVERHRRRAA
ncbi:hypothetical protein TH66_22620 [Carbonactinospora thermoautotrophica]|uniref:Putative antitoxin VapB45-like DNA-binding HTH domain-containing protein n=1 Tax=Carbonactinospora thermoautotrophica TaxID=1469144 RepID=A0A132MYQ5_9ACTN|nr:DUF433 domain-containing protein [Carbonactinospora thermoautotrophica]KWW98084.1 hypothetical protein TH66_22620 [Carbonactinospora thermoautotrophica]KWX02947.1 hypothetical protein LI90_3996 [Carbonactinospora thermoautotrophica]KWX06518.1 hypothetical protein TR74_21770 [Carbonactinospora thermoautotrophica]